MRVFGGRPTTAPVIQRKGKPEPEVLVEHRETRYVEELRGKPGIDGVDGVNAFPTDTVIYDVVYRRDGDAKVRYYRGLERVTPVIPTALDFKPTFSPQDAVVFDARQYRFTLAPDVTTVCPLGMRIKNINLYDGAVISPDLRDIFIPAKIVLPSFVANIPEFNLRLYVEFIA